MENSILDTFKYRLLDEMARQGMRQVDLCKLSGVPKSAMSHYCSGTHEPNNERLYRMAKALGVSPTWLMGLDVPKYETKEEEEKANYYIDKQTAETAQLIRSNKDLALLFDSAKDASPEDLRTVHAMLLALKRKENNMDQE